MPILELIKNPISEWHTLRAKVYLKLVKIFRVRQFVFYTVILEDATVQDLIRWRGVPKRALDLELELDHHFDRHFAGSDT